MIFDGRKVVRMMRIFPARLMSGENREFHRIQREHTVRVLLVDGCLYDVPRSAVEEGGEPPTEAEIAEAQRLWAERRAAVADRLNKYGEVSGVIEDAFARVARERSGEKP